MIMLLLLMACCGTFATLVVWTFTDSGLGHLPALRRWYVALRSWAERWWFRVLSWLAQAYLPVEPSMYAAATAVLALAAFIGGTLSLNVPAGVLLAALVCWLSRWYVLKRIKARSKYVAAELPTFLRLISGSLKSGFSLLQALEMAVREGPPLLANEVQIAIYEVNMGSPLEAALDRLSSRLSHDDVDLVVSAISVSREVGGNLSETMAQLANTIQERARLRRQIRVLTAQARLSGAIVAVLPFGLLGIMSFINPDYTAILIHNPLGWILMAVALVMEGLGIWWIRKIIIAGEEMLS